MEHIISHGLQISSFQIMQDILAFLKQIRNCFRLCTTYLHKVRSILQLMRSINTLIRALWKAQAHLERAKGKGANYSCELVSEPSGLKNYYAQHTCRTLMQCKYVLHNYKNRGKLATKRGSTTRK